VPLRTHCHGRMVKQGVAGLVAQTFGNPVISAVEQAPVALPGKTRTETNPMRSEISRSDFVIRQCTALLALCTELPAASVSPSLVLAHQSASFQF